MLLQIRELYFYSSLARVIPAHIYHHNNSAFLGFPLFGNRQAPFPFKQTCIGEKMKSTSHFAMGHLLYASLQKRGIYLNRIAFVYGNIAPDYTPAMLVSPHFNKVCTRSLTELISTLPQLPLGANGRVGAEYSKQLGIMCHFLCDYFCFAHNDDFAGSIKQHRKYEDELDAFMRRECLKLLDVGAKNHVSAQLSSRLLWNCIEARKEEYLSLGYTLENDLMFSFDACVTSISTLVALSQKVPVPATTISVEDIFTSLKGYATGDCLIYRMFFFRNRRNNIFFLPDLMPPIRAYA